MSVLFFTQGTMITTNRINLRKFSQSDIQSLQMLFSDQQVMAYSGGTLRPPDVQTWLQTRLKSYEVNDGIWIFAVELRSTGEMIGYCGLSRLQDMDGNIEIEVGYRLLPAFWGRGLATEAVLAVKEYAFSGSKLNRLTAMIDPANGSIPPCGAKSRVAL